MFDEFLRRQLFEFAVRTIVSRAIVLFPFLGWPFFNPLFLAIVQRLTNWGYGELKKEGIEIFIGVESVIERNLYDKAVDALKASFGKSPEEQEAASEEFDRRLRDIVHIRRYGMRENRS